MRGVNMLTSKSWREAYFYTNRLSDLFLSYPKGEIHDINNLSKVDLEMKHFIDYLSDEEIGEALQVPQSSNAFDTLKPELITRLREDFDREDQLPNEAFDWLKKNHRACAFSYHFFKINTAHKSTTQNLDNRKNLNNLKQNRQALVREQNGLNLSAMLNERALMRLFNIHDSASLPNSHKQRFEIIKQAFETGEVSIDGQQYLMRLLSEAWSTTLKNKSNVQFSRWLVSKDSYQVEWLSNYVEQQCDKYYFPWETIGEEESHKALQAYFDYQFLLSPKDTENLFTYKIRPAWNQRKHQNKPNGTKSRGVSMTQRTRDRLDWLVKEKDIKINAVIKDLIDQEFEALGGPSKL